MSVTRLRYSSVLVTTALGVAEATFGLVLMATPASAQTNTVFACATKDSVRIVANATSCRKDEVLVTWSITGPTGPPGPAGEPGAPGPQGPAGADGAGVTFVAYFFGTTYGNMPTGCSNGGAVYASGNPPVNTYVCNGSVGNGAVPASRCWANGQRYVDCGNGTVTDQVTGLVWLKDSSCLGPLDYAAAHFAAFSLKHGDCGLTDHSVPGQWRLPTKAEWDATTAFARFNGCSSPALTDNSGTGCYALAVEGPGVNERALRALPGNGTYPAWAFWMDNQAAGSSSFSLAEILDSGFTGIFGSSGAIGVWVVRSGPF